MSTRLSTHQRDFLAIVEVANRPVEINLMEPKRSLPHYVGHDFAYNWGFMTEREARRWLSNLERRGLITIEKDHFVRITDAGRTALAASKEKQG